MLALLLGRYAELVLSHFPAASLAPDVEMSVYKTLSGMGFTQPNTILADSSCADELNHDDTQQDITSIFRDRWGEVRSRASSQLCSWQSAAALLHRVRHNQQASHRPPGLGPLSRGAGKLPG